MNGPAELKFCLGFFFFEHCVLFCTNGESLLFLGHHVPRGHEEVIQFEFEGKITNFIVKLSDAFFEGL